MFSAAADSRLTGRESRIRQTVTDYLGSYANGDIESRVALFAPDASFEDPVGSSPLVGHEALRNFWLAGAGFTVQMHLELLAINGNEAAYVFTAEIGGDGDIAQIRTIETIEVDEIGLISRMRAYFDGGSIS